MDQDVHALAKLVRGGVNVNAINSGGYTPLGIASERGKSVAVRWLVSRPASRVHSQCLFPCELMRRLRIRPPSECIHGSVRCLQR